MFSIINICLALLTATVLSAGAIQGAVAYSRYCLGHDSPYYTAVFGLGGAKKCDFEHAESEYNVDVDFVAVVALSGFGALFWVSIESHYYIAVIKVSVHAL